VIFEVGRYPFVLKGVISLCPMRALKGVILNEGDVKKLFVENYELKWITSTKVFPFVAQVPIL
jgi:hypothetical protein